MKRIEKLAEDWDVSIQGMAKDIGGAVIVSPKKGYMDGIRRGIELLGDICVDYGHATKEDVVSVKRDLIEKLEAEE